MAIFKDNYFTNDSYDLRTSRLEILKNYIEYWAAPLAVPRTLVEWGLHANEKWQNALLISQSKRNQSDNFYQELHNTDEKTFKYYLKCKQLIRSTIPDENSLLHSFGVTEKFPRNRLDKIAKIEKFLMTYKRILESDKPYHVKADYIGLSFQELQNKIDYLSSDIKELQQLKKTLSAAKTLTQEGTPGKNLLKFAGTIPLEDLEIMRETIKAGCEQVDLNEW